MSWPADGKPRYVVTETVGTLLPIEGRGASARQLNLGAPEHRTVAILDRAFCHRVVFSMRTEDSGSRDRAVKLRLTREAVTRKLAELTGEAVAA